MVSVTKKINRGTLKKAAQAGKLWVKCQYHYTDDYAWDNAVKFGKQDEYCQAYFVPEFRSSVADQIDAIYAHAHANKLPAPHAEVEPLMKIQERESRAFSELHEELGRGKIKVREHDFTCKSGGVYENTFRIHSNLVYHFEIR